jgi:hypothetical protein
MPKGILATYKTYEKPFGSLCYNGCVAAGMDERGKAMLCFRKRSWLPLIFIITVSSMAPRASAFEDQRSTMTPSPSDVEQGKGASSSSASDAELTQRLVQSEAVVSGVVLEIARYPAQGPTLVTHHDPDWWRATIQIETVEKGAVSTKTVDVLYANSSDIAWNQSPKIVKGERGVWLLQTKDPFGKPTPLPAVVRALDRHPIADLAKVRTLLKNTEK